MGKLLWVGNRKPEGREVLAELDGLKQKKSPGD